MGRAVDEAEALAQELEARGDLTALNALRFDQMVRYALWGDFERGLATCERGFDVAARLGVPPVQYATIKAGCLLLLGRYGEAWRALQAEVADEAHPFGRAFRELGEGQYLCELAAYERAAATLRRVAEQATRLSRVWLRRAAESWLAVAALRAGALDRAWARGVWDELDTYWSSLPTVAATAEILLAEGDAGAALAAAEQAAGQAQALDLRPRATALAELRSRALLRLGRPEEALAAADEALPLAEAMRYRPMVWRLRAARAAALASLGRHEEAAAARGAAAALVRELAESIEDEALRRGFLANADVAAVAAD
jgi:tetratricopeptide (TPR) repeat protein